MEENVIDEIVNDTIKQIDEMPFGITEDEFENVCKVVPDENKNN